MNEEEMAYMDGLMAGECDPGKNNPYTGTSLAKHWEEGWQDGRCQWEREDDAPTSGVVIMAIMVILFIAAIHLIGAIYGYWTA